ncbi:Hypothetical_protein [Hexamita inflata]|uniref:Hypothetical_protein n=1 Tax=Hexamita inflata TaxID=28002 RepID=A0AA86PL28_9EUKA|nr:Hypothetical protein HINF_LOCUS9071 [Hexamita inflata]CAI9940463.1 Hypothetical protein HINF_LOCUS28108 [Hexamita inflata]
MYLDYQEIEEAICQQYLFQRYLRKLVKCRIIEAQYLKAIYSHLNLKFTNLRSQKDMIYLQDCSIIGLNISNRIADEEQFVDLMFLFQTKLISLIFQNVITQIYLVACYL